MLSLLPALLPLSLSLPVSEPQVYMQGKLMVCLINRNSSSHRCFSMIQNPHGQGLRRMTWCSLVRRFRSLGSAQGSHLAQAKTGRPWLAFPVHQSHEAKPTPHPPQIHRLINTFSNSLETLQCFVLYLCPPSG